MLSLWRLDNSSLTMRYEGIRGALHEMRWQRTNDKVRQLSPFELG